MDLGTLCFLSVYIVIFIFERCRPCSDLRGYAFDNSTTKKCWSVGERGPCPPQMKFMKNPLHEGYGECDCLQMKVCNLYIKRQIENEKQHYVPVSYP